MKGGWLEHEIRSLPHVLACSVSKDDVVVLVQPSAEPAAVERAVQEVLRRAGTDVPVRVVGGARPLFVEPIPIRNGRSAMIGSIGGAALLAAGVWLAGAAAGLRAPKNRAPALTLATPLPRELVVVPAVGGDGASAPLPTQEVTPPLLMPVRRPALAGVRHAERPASGQSPAPNHQPSGAPSPQPAPQPGPRRGLIDVLLDQLDPIGSPR